MKTMSTRDAETHFGQLLDMAQREPVLVTRDNRPVGILISMEDAAGSLIGDLYMDKESGHDAWLSAKVSGTLDRLEAGETALTPHAQVLSAVDSRLKEKPPASSC
ncbi:type II toxin-antitoxin system Phd/YefM family antitoxin [Amphibiibacter pelophylacis]|uniref:Type II toxin-antitoxin system Phd/YefM family antitoxin n=1 Tax=Amphibiibacter pelophylacis TaxID=1799477 RepID=A0ACC6P4F0_9BURK